MNQNLLKTIQGTLEVSPMMVHCHTSGSHHLLLPSLNDRSTHANWVLMMKKGTLHMLTAIPFYVRMLGGSAPALKASSGKNSYF